MKQVRRILAMIFLITLLLDCLVFQAFAVESEISCVGRLTYDGRSYALYDSGMTWFEAKEYCEKMGGHLVTITSAEEQAAVENLMESGQKKQYWMGLNLTSGTAQWITGESCDYTNWDRGEPNKCARADGQHEYYIHIYNAPNPVIWGSQRFKWNDMYYDNIFPGEEGFFSTEHCGFICEWEEEVEYFAQIAYHNYIYDLLSQSVNIQDGAATEVDVTVNFNEDTGKEKIYLSQDTTHAVELQNGVAKTIKPGEIFSADKDIYILIINEETGEATSTRTKLKIVKPGANGEVFPDNGVSGLNFKLGKECGFDIPDNVPVFGGATIKWDFDFIPISVEYDKEDSSKINVVFGANIAHSDGEKDQFFKDFDFKEYKKDFKNASKLKRSVKQLRGYFKNSKEYKMNLFGGKVLGGGSGEPSFDFDVAGYAEMKVINGQLTFVEGQLCLEVEASYNYQGQLFIWAVPVYYEIGGGIGGGLEGDMINLAPETFVPQMEAYVTAKLKGNLSAGVGVAKVATVGVGGEGSMNLKSALHKDYMKCWGEGSANINVKVLGKVVAKSDFLKGDFLVYETGNENGLIKDDAVQLLSLRKDLYAAVEIDTVYENESRAYTKRPTRWQADTVELMTAEYDNQELQLLAENIYTEAAPMICEIDGRKVMVMLWDAEERSDENHTMVVWSTYDEETGWSPPQPIHDDGTADFYPCFKDGYVVWQNEKSVLSDTMTLADIAALGEICLAKWNGNGFDEPVVLTNNDTLDTLPAVCSDGETVTIAWVNNSVNNILGLSGTNVVRKLTLGADTEILFTGTAPVVAMAAGGDHVAFVLDEDGELQTTEDWELYLDGEQVTDNDVLDSNPIFADDALYYYAGGNICIYNLTDGSTVSISEDVVPGLTDSFTVSTNGKETAVWWSGAAEGGTEVFCLLKKDGAWTDAVQLTEMDHACRYPVGVLESDGTMYLAFCHSLWEEEVVVQNDLYTLQVVPTFDLSVENVYVDEANMKVYATVRNKGQLNVDSYTIYLSDPAMNNTLTITEPLKAGEFAEVELEYLLSENMTKRTVVFGVTMEKEEYDTYNNTADVTLGNCDIEVQRIDVYEKLPESSAMVTISNVGFTDAESIQVYLRENKEDGQIVAEQTIQSLSAGESTVVTFVYDVTRTEEVIWYVTAETEDEEITAGNNAGYFINEAGNVDDYEGELLQCKLSETTLMVYMCVTNNTEATGEKVIAVSVYNADGQLKAVELQSLDLLAYETGSGVISFENYNHETGDYMKLFIMENHHTLKPLAAVTSADVYFID